jgi:hypothetical protein
MKSRTTYWKNSFPNHLELTFRLEELKFAGASLIPWRAAMPITKVAVDLAKDVFELAAADEDGKIIERRRLTRRMLERYFVGPQSIHVIMGACGTANDWARKPWKLKERIDHAVSQNRHQQGRIG